jgi:hypothetical protein
VGLSIGDDGGTALFASVVMVNVVVTVALPGMTVAGLNADVVRIGKPVTAKEIGVVANAPARRPHSGFPVETSLDCEGFWRGCRRLSSPD